MTPLPTIRTLTSASGGRRDRKPRARGRKVCRTSRISTGPAVADPEIRTEFLAWLDFRPPVDGLAAAPGLDACDKAARVVHKTHASVRCFSVHLRRWHSRHSRDNRPHNTAGQAGCNGQVVASRTSGRSCPRCCGLRKIARAQSSMRLPKRSCSQSLRPRQNRTPALPPNRTSCRYARASFAPCLRNVSAIAVVSIP